MYQSYISSYKIHTQAENDKRASTGPTSLTDGRSSTEKVHAVQRWHRVDVTPVASIDCQHRPVLM